MRMGRLVPYRSMSLSRRSRSECRDRLTLSSLTTSTAVTESGAISAEIKALRKQIVDLEKLIKSVLPQASSDAAKEGKLVDTD